MDSYRTPLARARGLGSAKHGAGHWMSERISALALVPLTLWLVYAVLTLAGTDYDGAVDWVGQPLNATLMALLTAVGFWHMHAGMRVIVEDYFHGAQRTALVLASLFVCTLVGALAVFSILKVALGGA
jgi:succinate dehydrogenase / fumarate reductase membrane anchor subunit